MVERRERIELFTYRDEKGRVCCDVTTLNDIVTPEEPENRILKTLGIKRKKKNEVR